jgi:DNA-binding response OmpR family regulator
VSSPHASATVRILVADDEPGTLALLSEMLTYSGFAVIEAHDGLEALVRAREMKPQLAVLDVMMPGMDGRAVCRQLHGDHAIPVILCSAADESVIDWRGAGAAGFLQKPFPISRLAEMVRQHVRTSGLEP